MRSRGPADAEEEGFSHMPEYGWACRFEHQNDALTSDVGVLSTLPTLVTVFTMMAANRVHSKGIVRQHDCKKGS